MNPSASLRRAGVLGRALAHQLRTPAPPAPAALDLYACATAIRNAGAQATVLRLDARAEPWTDTGLDLAAGASLTWLAHGDSWLLSRRGMHFAPAYQLRARTGRAAPALSGTGPTHTAAAPNHGRVELCCIAPGELHGAEERVAYDRLPRAAVRGGYDVVVAVWPAGTDVEQRLAAAAEDDPTGLCRREAERLADPLLPPDGWHPHRHIPLAGLHRSEPDAIAACSHGAVEIVCREARAPLTGTLELRWRWRLDRLPTTLAEDTLLTHDYLSVAVEFDDGQDLTYYWSAALPPETAYRCPFPHWRHRETHLVVRSGSDGLGRWQDERRRVAPDHAHAIGGPSPRAVVAVWLIATTIAQGDEARGAYASIELVDGETRIPVL